MMKKSGTSKILFREIQHFNQWWFWLILIVAFVKGIFDILKNLIEQNSVSEKDLFSLVTMFLVFIPIFLLFIFSKLELEISKEGIATRFFPFQRAKFFVWEEIEKAYVCQYKPLLKYGGWGVRGTRKNRALNVSGNWGLQLVMKNGKKLLIGTKSPEDIEAVLQKLSSEHIVCFGQ